MLLRFRKIVSVFLCFLIVMGLFPVLPNAGRATAEGETENIMEIISAEVTYENVYSNSYTDHFLYSDAFFLRKSSQSNPGLSIASAYLSAAVYQENSIRNVLVNEMKFEEIASDFPRATQENPHTIGYFIAKKDVVLQEEEYTIYSVCVRGTPASAEWISNFDIGMADDHFGFSFVAFQIADVLRNIVSTPKERTILWITGHSRGAAVANFVAGYLCNNKLLADTDQIYAFTYATPNVSQQTKNYSGIRNYVNLADFVTRVPLQSQWGFNRYGTSYSLSNSGTVEKEMKSYFQKASGHKYQGFARSHTDLLIRQMESYAPSVEDYYIPRTDSCGGHDPELFINGIAHALMGDIFTGLVKIGLQITSLHAVGIFANFIGTDIAGAIQVVTDNDVHNPLFQFLPFKHAHSKESYIGYMLAMYEDALDEQIAYIKDIYKYPFSIFTTQGGTVDASINGDYSQSERVFLSAAADPGYVFSHWTCENGTILHPRYASTTLAMPAGSASATAHFVPWSCSSYLSGTTSDPVCKSILTIERDTAGPSAFQFPEVAICIIGKDQQTVEKAEFMDHEGTFVCTSEMIAGTVNTVSNEKQHHTYAFPLSSFIDDGGQCPVISQGDLWYCKWQFAIGGEYHFTAVQPLQLTGWYDLTVNDTSSESYAKVKDTQTDALLEGTVKLQPDTSVGRVGCLLSSDRNDLINYYPPAPGMGIYPQGNGKSPLQVQQSQHIRIEHDESNAYNYAKLSYTAQGTGINGFDTELNPATTYYYRFFIRQSMGGDDAEFVFSDIQSFVTSGASDGNYQLTLAASEGGTVDASVSGSYAANTSVSLSAIPDEGYFFDGWFSNNAGVFDSAHRQNATFTMPSNDVTVTARFSSTPRYSLSVSPSCLDFGKENYPVITSIFFDSKKATITNTGNQTIDLNPITVPQHYSAFFLTEETSLAPGESYSFMIGPKSMLPVGCYDTLMPISSFPFSATACLELKYIVNDNPNTPKLYQLNLAADDGGYINNSVSGSYLSGETIRLSAVARPGFRFAGWACDPAGTLANPHSVSTIFTMPPINTTVTAMFERDYEANWDVELTPDVSDNDVQLSSTFRFPNGHEPGLIGCFMGTDYKSVLNATPESHDGAWMVSSDGSNYTQFYEEDCKGVSVFYTAQGTGDKGFGQMLQPASTYYYKFFGRLDGQSTLYASPTQSFTTTHDTVPDTFTYTKLTSTTCAINGYLGNADVLFIPSKLDGLTVTSIEMNACITSDCSAIILPDTLTSIGASAFWQCNNLRSVTLPASVTSFSGYSFADCGSLANIYVKQGHPVYYTINGVLFKEDMLVYYPAGRKATQYTIPDSTRILAPAAFHFNDSLTMLRLCEGMEVISSDTFYECSSLTDLWLPYSLNSIEEWAFFNMDRMNLHGYANTYAQRWCEQNGEFTFYERSDLPKFLYRRDGASTYSLQSNGCTITGYNGDQEHLVIPETLHGMTVTHIAQGAFTDAAFTTVTLPDTLVSIADGAFVNCDNLVELRIPKNVETISASSFEGCEKLAFLYAAEDNPSFASKDGMLLSKNGNTLLIYPAGRTNASYTLPDSISALQPFAFRDSQHLISLSLPEGITSLAADTFNGSQSIEQILFPNTLSSINANAFRGMASFTAHVYKDSPAHRWFAAQSDIPYVLRTSASDIVTLPGKLTVIQADAFRASGFKAIRIPDSCLVIRSGAFADCENLEEVYLPADIHGVEDGAFPDGVRIIYEH